MPEVKKNKKIVIIIFLLILIFSLAGIFYFKYFLNTDINTSNTDNSIENMNKTQIEIYKRNERPIAVMIDNIGDAKPQIGLNEAYIVYEIIVEGNQTRLMALFKGKNLDIFGPIRSARHYFLDYALENDAIFIHYGWSPKAKKDIQDLNIDNINGIVESTKSFWRIKNKISPHNVVTSTNKILEIIKRKKYRKTSIQESILNYQSEELNLNSSIDAKNVNIPYSERYSVYYKYNEETGRYTRYNGDTNKGKLKNLIQKDLITNEPITTKNIIITFANNTSIDDGTDKDRQNLINIGILDGYYITNGKAIKIKCKKKSRREQTIYEDLHGNEIKVNDGNTFIQIVPLDTKIILE